MTTIDRRDIDFLLHEVLDLDGLFARPRFADHDRGSVAAMLDTAEKLAADHFLPHAAKLDANEPSFDGETVHIIPEVKQALDAYCAAGFMAAHADYALGGMQLPHTVSLAVSAFFSAANISTAGYPFLTRAAANVIAKFGTEGQKAAFLGPMLEGRYFGTMALTEPGAGSGLADLKTAAVPAADGTYLITGNKIFISAGEHGLSENIVHLVLARIKGAPAGVKGISLFIVPKLLGDGRRNDVRLAGLIHKMGYRGTTSTMLNFGEGGGATGYLVGEAHRGLGYMFHMMNEARVGVGLGAAVLGYAGYRVALDYARTRLQGRPPRAKDPGLPPVPIVEHADVKRMLLASKAYVEGALALCLLGSRLVDDSETAATPAARDRAFQLLDLLTPVIKSWPSQYGLAANDLAIQVHGGYGYTREYPVERLYRDNRLNPIHEGTFGIQSLDLLGRKILGDQGKALALLAEEMFATINAAPPSLSEEAGALGGAIALVSETVAVLGRAAAGNRLDEALANSAVFLELMGHVVVAWLWLRMAIAAEAGIGAAAGDAAAFLDGKRRACRYFFRWELPKIRPQAALLQSLDQTCAEMPDAAFG
ncbi:acyl-CoA dehydrogenase [Zavarzinia compransoris]|uniref:Acyl-CoA dehydrogenase n=1 Tax=Zavarzinia compransoris TaxID=1264899 RepID=A0A317E6J0_9PROT|nr:acyl-CoA dehydrogenase [Zavarzinia compransoris]PWR21870.1 acyl-CoA dehydrogenase [Zavarzinia compransoris]TDP45324.1 butyryl-CoA dehydrogenase [Zavarzinia compransoris]